MKCEILSASRWALILFAALIVSGAVAAERMPASFVEKKFSVTVSDVSLPDLLKLIAQQGGVTIEVDESISGKASYSFQDTTLKDALERISRDHDFTFEVVDGVVFVDKTEKATSQTGAGSGRGLGVRVIGIKNANAKEISDKLPKIFKTNESLLVDDATNSLVFYGSSGSYNKLLEFVQAFDQMPLQIMIESQILETSKNFVRDVGFRWGSTEADPTIGKHAVGNGFINTGVPSNPNLMGKFLLGWIDGKSLEAHLVAAESAGDAKIISRPNVMTLNNQPATISSGVTFNVKTLSSTTTGGGGSGGTATVAGGLQQVTAGLNLQVHPIVVGNGLIRLKINVSNSEPNDGLAVDGIPGIVDNSAMTSIIVRDGNTAAIAGLIKSTLSESENRAPLLSRIPILGWFFKSNSKKDRNSELVILITPRIVSSSYYQPEKVATPGDYAPTTK
ncbi:MAG: hypothetical protein NDI61_11795 [Bdellovibrionaceae bacterium]|nr:hypothetical protein [Pseudobdellovibrionaceae bacterium]